MAGFSENLSAFTSGVMTPRAYLEACLAAVEAREAEIMAFAHLDIPAARKAADAATDRYRAGRPLSAVDGMPVGIKDVFDTADMPTEMGSVIHRGRRPDADAAHVHGLRAGGAIVLGKTVTSQFAIVGNGPTRNPHDTTRTPGATSAGSAAAVAAGMVPVATGSQARGSIIRPASYCGVFGFKPSFGALNRAGSPVPSKSYDHLGALAGTLDDLWLALWQIAQVAGGDPGHPELAGKAAPPRPRPVTRLALLETAGWAEADDAAKAALLRFIDGLRADGIAVLTGKASPALAALEADVAEVPTQWEAISNYENRWPLQSYDRTLLHPGIVRGLDRGAAMTPDDYRAALAYRARLRASHSALAAEADACITLSAPGEAPLFPDSGSSLFNEPATLLGAPAVSLPLLETGGLPLGVQLIGWPQQDYRLLEHAAFLMQRKAQG